MLEYVTKEGIRDRLGEEPERGTRGRSSRPHFRPLPGICFILFSFLETRFHFGAQDGLEVTVFLPQPPNC